MSRKDKFIDTEKWVIAQSWDHMMAASKWAWGGVWSQRNVLKLDCGGLHNSVNSLKKKSLNCILKVSDFYVTQTVRK